MLTEEKLAFAESNNRLLDERLKQSRKECTLLKKERDSLKQDLLDVEEFVDLKRCDACGHLFQEDLVSDIGNEQICYVCKENGFGE